MAFKLANRVNVLTSTTGTGSIALGSAVAGFQTFLAAGVANGDTVRYTIEDGVNFEIGVGTLSNSVGTMARSVSESSNSDNAITLSGNATVFLTATSIDIQTGVNITGGAVTGITDLTVADGGTGASTISAAQTNLQVDPAGTAAALAIALG